MTRISPDTGDGGVSDHGDVTVASEHRQPQQSQRNRVRRRLSMSSIEQMQQQQQQQQPSEPQQLLRIRFPPQHKQQQQEGELYTNANILMLKHDDSLSSSSSLSSPTSTLPQQPLQQQQQQQHQQQQQSLPPQSLSLFWSVSESPIPTYDAFLVLWLFIWVLYLLLPKGFRVTFCKAYPKRYARSSGKGHRFLFGMPSYRASNSISSSVLGSSIAPSSVNSSGFFSNTKGIGTTTIGESASTSTGSFSKLATRVGGNQNSTPNMYSQASVERQQRRRQVLYETLIHAKKEGQQQQMHNNDSHHNTDTDIDSGIGATRSVEDASSLNSSYGVSGIEANRSVMTTGTTNNANYNQNNNHGDGTLLSGIGQNRSIDLEEVLQEIDEEQPWKDDTAQTPPKTPMHSQQQPQHQRRSAKQPEPPSPKHPALSRIPTEDILSETMVRFRGRGIRLMAHGVQCRPKRVWVRLDLDAKAVTWQTETPRRIQAQPQSNNSNNNNDVSIIMVRGSVHSIPLRNVLYIDVGKKTTALIKDSTVEGTLCFSLLTASGSLDLQSNSKLERDALVSCLSFVLDEMNGGRDWRALYEPSLIMSDHTGGTKPTTDHGSSVLRMPGGEADF